MNIETWNPYTGEKIASHPVDSSRVVEEKIKSVRSSQREWSISLDERIHYLKNILLKNLREREREIATQMSLEMGKPLAQSISEVRKCQLLVEYAISKSHDFLNREEVQTEGKRSYISFEPLGTVLLIMPWNFPLWQVMRAAVPAMAAGNGVVLKHASIVTGFAKMIEEIFSSPVFRTLVLPGSAVLDYMRFVDGVSFTGSSEAGAKIAAAAASNIKKTVLELGGSDPFIVLKSAEVRKAAKSSVFARLQNNGQSCIASKRFIVHSDVYEEFASVMKEEYASVITGDPMDERTFLGPLSSREQAATVQRQIKELSAMGRVETLGEGRGNIIPPTVVETDADYPEEVFGPVAVLRKVRSNEEAVRIANETPFGLGACIWGDVDEAEALVPQIEAGMVFINRVVASDPRLPFGGIKKSGYGRELSRYGMLEFTNIKTVWVENR
jgi:acyl-CoA reductase-like NAD-dependent aldehyde dehydrogenase